MTRIVKYVILSFKKCDKIVKILAFLALSGKPCQNYDVNCISLFTNCAALSRTTGVPKVRVGSQDDFKINKKNPSITLNYLVINIVKKVNKLDFSDLNHKEKNLFKDNLTLFLVKLKQITK